MADLSNLDATVSAVCKKKLFKIFKEKSFYLKLTGFTFTGCCAHCRAVDYFTESITTEIGFRSIYCDSWDNYLSGACDENESVLMGEYVDTS
jgi:phosphatidic acid-selective phospholipase A1